MSFFQRNKSKVILISITVLLVVFMAISTISGEKSNIFTNVANIILSPVQKGISATISGTTDFFTNIITANKYADENEDLKTKLASLETDVRETENLKKENARLREMLELKERTDEYELAAAEVIANETGNWFGTFTIDKGTSNGIAKNCTVITNDGLVGYVYDVGTTWAKVKSIIDSTCAAGALVERTGDIFIAEGDISLTEKGLCKMTHVENDVGIKIGDQIETSGLDGLYPSGIYIGKIKEITPDSSGLSREALIEPAVDFESLSEVFVMISGEESRTDE